MHLPRGASALVAFAVLLCIGVGLGSLGLSEETEQAGYYDGDDDDAGAIPPHTVLVVDFAVAAIIAVEIVAGVHFHH